MKLHQGRGIAAALGAVGMLWTCQHAAIAQTSPAPILVPEGAKPGAEVLVTLASGETLRCVVEEVREDVVVLMHPVLGKIEAPRAQITQLVVDKAAPPPPPPPPPPTFFEGWTGSIEGGVNGSEGNTETLSLRFGLSLERITDTMETRFGTNYSYTSDAGEKTKSRGELTLRNDWLFKNSPWGFFAQGKAEYDEFQDWLWRTSAFAGPSYTFIKDDDTLLRARAGLGASKEFGGERQEIMPEALIGLDFEKAFSKHQKFFVSTELLPDLDDGGEFRWNTKVGYEVMIDPKANLSLRMGIDNRYVSDPADDSERNDVDYFALLAWSF